MHTGQCIFRNGVVTPEQSPRSSLEVGDAAAVQFLLEQACIQQQQQQQQQQLYVTPAPSPVAPVPAQTLSAPEQRLGSLVGGRYLLEQVAGVGAYGVVYVARDIHTGLSYAIKALNKVGLDARQERFQRREILHHHHACRVGGPSDLHPNIVSLVNIIDNADCLFAVMEYCPEGDLFMNITERQRYFGKDSLIRDVFLQILDAVEHCHRRGIYHRDLKPENIMVADDGCTVKLADFGLATKEIRTADHGCGSQFYMSPECLQPQPIGYDSAPNDIWSLGVILVNLTCGRNPWRKAALDDSTYRGYMNDRTFLQSILPLTSSLNYILTRMFEPDPTRRATIAELRELMRCCTKLTTTSQETMPVLPTPVSVEALLANSKQHLQPLGGMTAMQAVQAGMFAQNRYSSVSQTSFSSASSAESVDSMFSEASAHSSCSSNSDLSQMQDVAASPSPYAKAQQTQQQQHIQLQQHQMEICAQAPQNTHAVQIPAQHQAQMHQQQKRLSIPQHQSQQVAHTNSFRDMLPYPFQQYAYKQQQSSPSLPQQQQYAAAVADEYVSRFNRPSFFRPDWQQCFRFNFGNQLFSH